MYYACMKRFFNNCPHVWSGRRCKTSQILYVFLTREMLVHLVNFEKCHSPIHSWPTQTGTVSDKDKDGSWRRIRPVAERSLRTYSMLFCNQPMSATNETEVVADEGDVVVASRPFFKACGNYGHQRRTSRLCTQNTRSKHYQGTCIDYLRGIVYLSCLSNLISRACTSVLTCRRICTYRESNGRKRDSSKSRRRLRTLRRFYFVTKRADETARRYGATLHNEMGTRGPPTTVPVCVDSTPRVRQIPNDFSFYLVIARFASYAPRGPYVLFGTRSE